MQIEAQDYLRLTEAAQTIAFLDIEANGLRGDYNSALCISIKPVGGTVETLVVKQVGNDRGIVREASKLLASYDLWVTYYGKGFDIPMLNTRLLKWGDPPIPKRPHLDMYYSLKSNILTARRSQGHLLAWLGTPEQKMTIGADVWNQVAANPKENLDLLVQRCESDVNGLEDLYQRTKHLIREIKK